MGTIQKNLGLVEKNKEGVIDDFLASRNPGKVLNYHGASVVVRYMIERSRK